MNNQRKGMASVESLLVIAVGAMILMGLTQYWKTSLAPQTEQIVAVVLGEVEELDHPETSGFQTNRPEDTEVLVWKPTEEVLYDSEGNIVATRNIGLQTPLYDPIDFVLDIASLGTASAAQEILATVGIAITNVGLRHVENVRSTNGVITIEIKKQTRNNY